MTSRYPYSRNKIGFVLDGFAQLWVNISVLRMFYSFSYLEPVCCSSVHSNCCFLTCIQISQEARINDKSWRYMELKLRNGEIVLQLIVEDFNRLNIINQWDLTDIFRIQHILYSTTAEYTFFLSASTWDIFQKRPHVRP